MHPQFKCGVESILQRRMHASIGGHRVGRPVPLCASSFPTSLPDLTSLAMDPHQAHPKNINQTASQIEINPPDRESPVDAREEIEAGHHDGAEQSTFV